MRQKRWLVMLPILMMSLGISSGCRVEEDILPIADSTPVVLPAPILDGDVSVEKALRQRRSVRDYDEGPLTLLQVGQLLWASQGITSSEGWRTAPSAGGLYPLEVYVVTGDVAGIAAAVYRYQPDSHTLVKTLEGDQRQALTRVALNQEWVSRGAIDIVIAADYERTTGKYGERGIRYVHLEAGHAAQNIYLEAVALGLGTVSIGAFDDDGVKRALGLPDNHAPLYIMPVGKTGGGE